MLSSCEVRPVRNTASPSGMTVMMYNLPELFGAHKQRCRIPEANLHLCIEECEPKKPFPCDETVLEICFTFKLTDENHKDVEKDVDGAILLCKYLRNIIQINL